VLVKWRLGTPYNKPARTRYSVHELADLTRRHSKCHKGAYHQPTGSMTLARSRRHPEGVQEEPRVTTYQLSRRRIDGKRETMYDTDDSDEKGPVSMRRAALEIPLAERLSEMICVLVWK